METLFLNLLSLTGPISVLIALLWALTPLMRKSYAAKWRQYMWIFCAVRLLLPVKLFSSSLCTIELPAEAVTEANMAGAVARTSGVKLITVLSAIWLLGAAVFLAIQLISYISFRHSVKRWSKNCNNGEIMKIFAVSKAVMGVKRDISLQICKKLKSPMVTGFIKPVLLLSHEDYGADEAEIIIRHELIHFKKHHLWYKLLLLFAESVSWFNPFTYIMFNVANKDMELACDDEVIRNSDYAFRQKYCETILNGIHNERGRASVLTTCLNINKKTLLDRFGNILNMSAKKNGVLICLAVSVSLVAMSGVISFAEGRVSQGLSEVFDYEPQQIMDTVLPPSVETAVPEYALSAPSGEYASYSQTERTAADETEAKIQLPVIDKPVNDIPAVYDDTSEPYMSGAAGSDGGVYADINIEGSRSFRGEEITAENSRMITVETSEGAIDGTDDSFTAYIRLNENGYEMVRTE